MNNHRPISNFLVAFNLTTSQHPHIVDTITSARMAPKKNTAAVNKPGRPFQNIYVVDKVWNGYWETTSHQTLLIDAFLAFLLVVGAVQAFYFVFFSHDVSYPH